MSNWVNWCVWASVMCTRPRAGRILSTGGSTVKKIPPGVSRFSRDSRLVRYRGKETKMTRYVFIQSRDPFEARDPQFLEETAIAVTERGHEVTVFLVQNGVLAARQSTPFCTRNTVTSC